LSYSRFQTSETGGQRYSDTSPFSIPWSWHQSRNRLAGLVGMIPKIYFTPQQYFSVNTNKHHSLSLSFVCLFVTLSLFPCFSLPLCPCNNLSLLVSFSLAVSVFLFVSFFVFSVCFTLYFSIPVHLFHFFSVTIILCLYLYLYL
jgi:hypothetical protein